MNREERITKMAINKMAAFILVILAAISLGSVDGYRMASCDNYRMNHNCTCSEQRLSSTVELLCSFGASDYVLRITLGDGITSQIAIECLSDPTLNYFDSIPDIKLGEGVTKLYHFEIKLCPAPPMPYAELLARFGAEKTSMIRILAADNATFERRHFTGLNGVGRLKLEGKSYSYLPSDIFADLETLPWLTLAKRKINITKETFANMRELKTLELHSNEITSLSSEIFSPLTKLERLSIMYNRITKLDGNVFAQMTNLGELELYEIEMPELPKDLFGTLTNLERLALVRNNFTSLPEGIFKNNVNLQELILKFNNGDLKSLPRKCFANLPKLNRVDLNFLNLETIPEDAFENSIGIKEIYLNENKLSVLPLNIFKGLTNLSNLELSSNNISVLLSNIFQTNTALEALKLNKNKIEALEDGLFDNQFNLKKLMVSKNKLNKIGTNIFRGTKQLAFIDLSFNELDFSSDAYFGENSDIAEGPSPFQSISAKLKVLNLSHNNITKVHRDWSVNAIALKTLNLSHNKIAQVAFSNLYTASVPITMDLTHNNLQNIIFDNPQLYLFNVNTYGDNRTILIDNNPFKCDCMMYSLVRYFNKNIETNVLDAVKIVAPRAECREPEDKAKRLLISLKQEELRCIIDDENQCPNDCECFYRPSNNFTVLNCNNGKFDESVLKNISFSEVHLERGGIEMLTPDMFTNNVRELHLRWNNLTILNPEDIPTHVQVLDLRDNKLERISAEAADMITNHTNLRLFLSGNPIECVCENSEFISTLQTNWQKIDDFANVTCKDGRYIKDVTSSSLCGPPTLILTFSILMCVFGMLTAILAALYFKFNNEIKVYLFAKGWLLCCVTEEEIDKDKLYDAFISFSQRDHEFVADKLMPNLEHGPNPFKLCYHHRNWIPGESIAQQVVNSINDSRRTIVVLSKNFLESEWTGLEFRTAHAKALKEGRQRLIVIIYGDIESTEILDADIRNYIKTTTYVKWGDPWFWQKLRYAMPHPQKQTQSNPPRGENNKSFDKLELINSNGTTPTSPTPHTTPPHQAYANPLMNGYANGNNCTIMMNGLKINGNAKHSDV